MTGKVVTFHSYRGGTGKTSMSLNLASLNSKLGKNVCLLELDFRAPTLHSIFEDHPKMWMNDFLDGRCDINDVLIDYSGIYGMKGKFLVGLANPEMKTIQVQLTKGRKWQMEALRRLLFMGEYFTKDMMMDCVFMDSSPGIEYSSLNAIVASDLTVVVTSLDRSDVSGTNMMVREFQDAFEKKALVLVNKFVGSSSLLISDEERRESLDYLNKIFRAPILGMIPCYCDLNMLRGAGIFVLEKPEHPFVKCVEEVAERLNVFELC